MDVVAVVDLQYGSTGKGMVADFLGCGSTADLRTGGPQAGHTFRVRGEDHVHRSLPVGVWGRPYKTALIGPGAIVDYKLLCAETEAAERGSARPSVYIHHNAWLLHEGDRRREETDDMAERMGSTQEGVGSARIRRILRNPDTQVVQAGDVSWPSPIFVVDGQEYWQRLGWEQDGYLVLEGHQGFGLSLFHGPYPYTTSADTTVAALLSEAGIPPSRLSATIGVLRTYEIRVGGNSGPMWEETSWEALGFPAQRTTVTGRIRRVGKADFGLLKAAVQVNGVDALAVTHLDMLPESERRDFVVKLEQELQVPVWYERFGMGKDEFAIHHLSVAHHRQLSEITGAASNGWLRREGVLV